MAYDQAQIGDGAIINFDPEVKNDDTRVEGGPISPQSEDHPVECRTVRLLNLKGRIDSNVRSYCAYFVTDDKASCRY